MHKKICLQEIFEQSMQIEFDDIKKNGKTNLFGKKVNFSKNRKNACKNCNFIKKNGK